MSPESPSARGSGDRAADADVHDGPGFFLHLTGDTPIWEALREVAAREGSEVVLATLKSWREMAAAGDAIRVPRWSVPGECSVAEIDALISAITGSAPDPSAWSVEQRVTRDPEFARVTLTANDCDPMLLERFAADWDAGFANFYARENPRTPVSALAALAASADLGDRLSAALARATPPVALARLLEDPDEGVRLAAASNEWAPADLARRAVAAGLLDPLAAPGNGEVPWDVLDDVAIGSSEAPGWRSRELPAYLLWRFAGRTGCLYGLGWDHVWAMELPPHAEGETFGAYAARIEASHGEAVRSAYASALAGPARFPP